MMRFLLPLLLPVLLFAAERISVTDAFGNPCEITLRPKRTVLCYPSLLEIWMDCGGALAGMHTPQKTDILPPGTESIPKVGSYMHPNAEIIVHLKPDLVILSGMTGRHRPLGDLLRKSGIEVLYLKYDNYADYRAISALFSRILGRKELAAEPARVEREVQTIRERCRKRKGPTFLVLLFNGAEFRAETNQAHASSILSALGGRNILRAEGRDLRSQRASYSREELLLQDPDCIFLIPAAKSAAVNREAIRKFIHDPALQSLKAVRTGRLHVLPPELFHYKPNKRFPDAFRHAEKLLYPEAGKTTPSQESLPAR